LRRHSGGPKFGFLHQALVAGLAFAYGVSPAPQAIFDPVLALLSATSYTTRFAIDLEDDFPHVPLPVSPGVVADAATIEEAMRGM